jgi:hypothetical protein
MQTKKIRLLLLKAKSMQDELGYAEHANLLAKLAGILARFDNLQVDEFVAYIKTLKEKP